MCVWYQLKLEVGESRKVRWSGGVRDGGVWRLSNELKRSWEAFQEISDKDFFKALVSSNWKCSSAKTWKCFKEEVKDKRSYSKRHILGNYQFCILGCRIGPGWLSVRWQAAGWQIPGVLGDGRQEVWSSLVVWITEARWVCKWVLQVATRGLSGGPDVYLGFDGGLESPKNIYVPRLVRTRM